ncbi:WhiB family transcriptional regulator [Corynebacterium sp. 320]|uniref:Transcriptional regulator WhiB n=1 Tax=Corynebacterium zhongnanshanii TaxID=2768834 RepID=A0ABQ6VGI9_9CORY|nr:MULTISPECIES: WhiB family transcriptional regulator [Corynebacterium]KAB1504240.1 WhiB family transcriptional regulator [Corynebacterium sp. 320]KAB1552660.1 WhiB family transcriptional regulator [Corynebacterium sp. 321]KAB1554122.1 WhiB family transcriptional regulator [Corynebacterium sp. 319]KAB3522903.1 WhiB family transcriptional regulator [Corynebacterium zhongnanshanii]KAB3528376.1 WhiB family transcriptional regulator [Corynebacterium sp. 250]
MTLTTDVSQRTSRTTRTRRSTPILRTYGSLPGSATHHWDWQMQGSCRGADSTEFFHPDGERGQARARREARAKAICAQCPVMQECRDHALRVGEPYGIWGGLSESEREEILSVRAEAS